MSSGVVKPVFLPGLLGGLKLINGPTFYPTPPHKQAHKQSQRETCFEAVPHQHSHFAHWEKSQLPFCWNHRYFVKVKSSAWEPPLMVICKGDVFGSAYFSGIGT